MPNNEPKKQENFNFKNFIQKNEIKPIKDGENKDVITTREDVTSVRGMEDLKKSDFEDYGNIYEGQDINKTRYENQSGLEQFGSWATQSAGEIIGGAISGIGATGDIFDAMLDEYNDKDADFKNLVTEAGDAITQWSKNAAPIYRQNPGKAFDVTDSGWWFESGVSIASTLALLAPAVGTVKGLSYVGKALKLSDELAVAGKLVKGADKINKLAGRLEKAKYFAKIGTSAIVSRNAENFKESAQVLNDTKNDLLKEWDENPDKFNELANSDVAKELQAEGRPIDKENLANFIASKAAWLSYGVNSLNIGFDALQLAPLFKGFKPVTQISKLETSAAIKTAQKAALGKTFTKMNYLTSALNPLSSAFARNASEGLEEAINYVGTEEGKAYADRLTGKKTKDLSGRVGDYLVDPHMYESAVWGVLGGMAFGGAANGLGRVANLVKGKDGYGLKEARINEINKRVSQIKETSEAIKQIESDPKLNDEEKSHYIANVKADAITKLTINAAQVGNYKMLVEHLSSPQMKKEMLENGYAKEEDVDKAIAKSLLDAQTAVEMYKTNYSLFQTRNVDENVKNIQIAEKTYWDSVSSKHLEQKNKLAKDIQTLKAKDNYYNTSTDSNKDLTIELEGLKQARKSVSNLTIELEGLKQARKSVSNITENASEPLSEYQKEILATTDKRIADLESKITEKASLSTLNSEIVKKQTQLEQKSMIIEALGHKAKYMTTPAFSQKIKEQTEKVAKERKDKDINDFKDSIKDKSKEELETLKTTTKDKAKKDIIDSSIKDLTKKAESTTRKETVLKTKEVKENTKPTRTDDEIFDYFDEEFETVKIDETKLNPEIKQLIDIALSTKNYASLMSGIVKYEGTLEQQYIKNKITGIKEGLLNPVNEAKENLNLNTKEENITEPIIDDKAINDEINRNKPKIKNGDIFGKEVSSVDADIKPFIHILKPLNFNGEIQINEDKNGNLILTAELDKSVKALYSLKPTDKIEVKIDNTNKYYEQYKEDAKNIPLAIYLQGEKIGYLSTLRNLDYQVSQQTIDENNQEIELIKQIRNEIGTDLTKSTDLVVKRLQKGTIINTKEYYPVKNLNGVTDESFWIVKTDTDNSFVLENLKTGEVKPHFNELRKGVIYVGVQNLDDTFFPSPLSIGKLDENDSKVVEKHIFDLLDVLDSGLSVISKEANDLKDKISNYIRVDNTENYFKEEKQIQTLFKELQNLQKNKESEEKFKEEIKQKQAYYKELRSKRNLSFRVHEKSKDGKAARVEIGYVSPNTGEKRHITLYKTSLILRDENETKIATVRITSVDGVLRYFDEANKQINENPLQKTLQHRYKNINFKAFKQDKAYRDKMLNSNVLLTNVGELRTSTGKTISNFTDSKPILTTKKEVEQAEKENKPNPTNQEVKDNTNNSIDQAFEGIFDKQVSEKVIEIENKTSKEILTDIVKNAESKTIKDAAEFALQHIEKNDVIVKYVSNLPDTTPATYNVTTNTIQINKNVKNQKEFQENFLHEVYHALTLLPLIKHINFKVTKENELDYNDFEFKPNTPKEVKDFIQQITNLRKEAERKIRQKYPDITKASIEEKYGIKNNFEFISEVITNPQFREFLKAGDVSIFEKILDAIVTFLNKYLKTNFSLNKSKDLDNSVKTIFNYISAQNAENYKKLENGVEHIFNSEFAEFKKTRSEKVFTNEELSELVNFTSFASLKYYKNGTNLQNVGDNTDTSKKESLKAKEFVKKAFTTLVEKSKDKVTPVQSALLNKALENFDTIWAETTRQINRTFGIDIEINDINLDDTVQQDKQWEAKFTEMLPLSKEIKEFLSTFVAKNSDGTLKINPVTGLNVIVPFKEVITPIKVNLTKANNTQEVLTILNEMKALNPVYGDIAKALSQDYNKLNAFKTTFSGYIVKSRLNLLRKTYKDEYKAKSINELEFAQAYIKIAKEWSDIIDANIQKGIYNTEEFRNKKTELDKKISLYVNKEFNFKDENGDLNKEGEELISTFKELALLYELPVKSITIESNIFNARNLDDTFYKALQGIGKNISQNLENNSTGDLRSISKVEENFNFKYAHLMGQNAKGEMISAYNLNSFMSNYMKRLKSTDKATRQEVENEFRKIVDLDPTAQYQFWFWNTTETVGLFDYDVVNGKKIPTTLNQKFIDLLDIENIGGVKNETTKEALESSELASFDELVNYAVAYLAPTENKRQKQNNYIYIPSITQSDSQNQTYVKVPRVPINSTDISFEYGKNDSVKAVKINEDSLIFKQFQNIVAQEVARRLQASNYMFDSALSSENTKLKDSERLIVNPKYFDYNTNSLTEEGKKWFATLETNYHYGKIAYKKGTNEVDLLKTLFEDGKLTGKVFTFHNIKEINNVEAFKTAYFTPLTISDFKSITPTIQKYLNKMLLEEFKDWKEVNNKKVLDGLYSHIGNGSFESFISEFALNVYLGNAQQQMWFNGVTAQFKKIGEVGKRGKLPNAPGTPNTSSNQKRVFGAITIKDSILQGKNLDFIAINQKDNLIKEQGHKFTKEEIDTFNLNNILKDLGKTYKEILTNKLELETYKLIKNYLNINSADAQGYMTVEGLKDVLTSHGKMNATYEAIFKQLENDKQLTVQAVKTIQATKYLYFHNSFNETLNKMSPNAIKNSYVILLPQLIKGTELEKINEIMIKKGASRLFMESAHKIGAKKINKITNDNGSLNEAWLNEATVDYYDFLGEQEQLTIPDHLVDYKQLLATQISKLIINNLSNNADYTLYDKKLTGTELRDLYFSLVSKNIEESTEQLIEDLKITKDEDGNYKFENLEALQKILLEEIQSRGEAKSLEDAISIVNNDFLQPLSMSKNAEKFESILTSLFTNRIMKQKLPGALVVNQSDLFINKGAQEQSSNNVKEGVNSIFEVNSNLSSIGTQEQYSQYLDTIFPDSKVKDILYHGTPEGQFENFDVSKSGKLTGNLTKGIYFTDSKKTADFYAEGSVDFSQFESKEEYEAVKTAKVFSVLLNAKNLKLVNDPQAQEKQEDAILRTKDKLSDIGFSSQTPDFAHQYIVFDTEQVHILGSEQDLEGFKNYVKNTPANITGIEWQNGHDGILKAYRQNENGIDVDVIEVVMGSWSSQCFKDGKRMSINDIPDDVKTMIAYRIPTSGKNLMVVIKVVGLLPEESKGTIIMPNNLIAQMGLDFDIDKMNIIYKHFYINKKGEFKIPTYGTKEEFDYLSEKLKELREEKKLIDKDDNGISDAATTKLFNDSLKAYGVTSVEEDIEETIKQLKPLSTFDTASKTFIYNEKASSRQSRDNAIIDIFKSILLNKNHLAESFSDINFETYENFKEQIEGINHKNDDNLDILSAKGQRLVKKRNMAGVVLKGLAANLNAFVSISQQVGMELIDRLAIPVKYRISGTSLHDRDTMYNLKSLKKKYPNLTVEGDYAIIKHKKYGKTQSGEYTNVDGHLIDMVVSQPLAASLDNASKPVFDSFNGTTYTLPQFQTALTLGVPDTYMMTFTSQPILVKLNNEFFDNKGVLIENTDESKVRERVRARYESLLFNLLVEDGQFKATKHSSKTILNNPKVYTAERRQVLFNYSLESEKVFSEGELWNMIVQANKWGTISASENAEDLKEKIEYVRNQLYILNQFNKNKEAGDATQDILRATKTDGLGAGPSLSTSVDLFNLISKVGKDNKIVTDKGINAISSIYPTFFGLDSKSTYLPLETLLLNVNKLSFDVLGNSFIEQNSSFKSFKEQVKTFKKDKKEDKKIKQFFNKTLYQNFDMFNEVDSKLILGLESKGIKTINTITDFQNSTLEEQFNYIKKHNKDSIEKSYNHILNNISFTNDIVKNGFVTLDFNTNYKDVSLDDTFSEQIENLYESGDEYNKMFVENLIKYTYYVHGLEFQFGSLIRVIPSTVLSDSKVIDYYREQLNNTINVDVDKYYKNNWLNTSIVPLVATKVAYKDKSKKEENEEAEGEDGYSTIDNTPVWNGNQDVLVISSKSLSNEKDNVKNSPYIRISTSTTTFDEEKQSTTTFENHLYKRHKEVISFSETSKYNKVRTLDEQTGKYKYLNVSISEENGNLKIGDREYDINSENINDLEQIYEIIPNTIYFYKVNPLGKNSFIEVTNQSIFEENNKVKEYNVLLDLESKISGVDVNTTTNFTNVPKDQSDELNNCPIRN